MYNATRQHVDFLNIIYIYFFFKHSSYRLSANFAVKYYWLARNLSLSVYVRTVQTKLFLIDSDVSLYKLQCMLNFFTGELTKVTHSSFSDFWYQMILPPHFDSSKKYPLLLEVWVFKIHGNFMLIITFMYFRFS